MAKPGLSGFQQAATAIARSAGGRVMARDWSAIGIEILIVVLGILIAFQIERWNEGRSKARAERVYVQRVEEESRANIEAIERIALEDERNGEELLNIIRALGDPRERAAIPGGVNYGCGMLHLPAARTQSAYLELAGPSSVELGRDLPLRALIGLAMGSRHFTERQLDYFRAGFHRFSEQLDRYTVWQVDPVNGAFTCTVALDALAADPLARSTLARLYRDRQRFLLVRQGDLGAQRKVNARARCLLDGNCAD